MKASGLRRDGNPRRRPDPELARMVRPLPEACFKGRHPSTPAGRPASDFTAVAAACGLVSRRAHTPSEIASALAWLRAEPDDAALRGVMIDPGAHVHPTRAGGSPFSGMPPLARPLATEGIVPAAGSVTP